MFLNTSRLERKLASTILEFHRFAAYGPRSRYTSISTLLFSALVTVSCAGSCVSGVPRNVTCDDVRALRVGMNQSNVRALLGTPREQIPGRDIHKADAVEVWTYDHTASTPTIGIMRFDVEYESGRLSRVVSYYSYPWDKQERSVFRLTANETQEGADFSAIFGCNK